MDLKPWEIVCDKCNGTGIDGKSLYVCRLPDSFYNPFNPPHIEKTIIGSKCNKCIGEGKVDWIENIFGKRNPEPYVVSQIMRSSKKPKNPRHGDMYYNITDKIIYLYTVDEWIRISEEI